MKYSKQREHILKTLRENVIHPTADEIYALARKGMPSLSLATVYRNPEPAGGKRHYPQNRRAGRFGSL